MLDLDRLRFILPSLIADNPTYTASDLNELGFQFIYNQKGQVIEKRVPSGQREYFVYDKYDRLVLTQNHHLGQSDQWLFVKYDRANRPVITGLYTDANDRQTVQTTVLNSTDEKFESPDSSAAHGYTNEAFPGTVTEYLVVNYYDTYENAFKNYEAVSGYSASSIVRSDYAPGLQTASKVKVLNSTTWIESVYYEDVNSLNREFGKYGFKLIYSNSEYLDLIELDKRY